MKRTGFLASIAGALAASQIPGLSAIGAPSVGTLEGKVLTVTGPIEHLPAMLAYSESVTRDLIVWNTFSLAYNVTEAV
jgi:hypothetical protein